MKRSVIAMTMMLFGAVVLAQRGGPPSPEAQAALAKQEALEKSTAPLQITEEVLPLTVPGHTIGEAVGVAKNSKGHLFVFTRSGNTGPAKGATASQLFEFDPMLKFVKQWGPDNYAASFAHTVRVDRYDNVWMTDEGANMIVKFNPQGMVSMVLGRKPEAIDYLERFTERGEKETERYPAGNMGTFNRPTDVTWDQQDNIFVSDGYNNSRVVKISKNGKWVKALGTRGAAPNQFNTPHGNYVRCQGQHLRRRSRQSAHPGLRQRSQPGAHHRKRRRAVEHLHVTRRRISTSSAAMATANCTRWI